jgi:glyoxylase-like metal-dependent hydrolase (beta-lactamase superfamily II)
VEVYPGIHRVPSLRWSNAYLLVEPEGLTLIDAGVPGDGKKILRYIQDIGRDPSELLGVVLTHSHPDHTGPVKGLFHHTGATIFVHPADTRQGARPDDFWLHYPGQPPSLVWDIPFLHRIPAHQFLEDGQVLPVLGGLQVLHTPGHTPGSICLYGVQKKVIFTGDTLLADGYSFRRPLPFPGTNFRKYRASVERLAQLPFEVACVGHGRPVLQGGSARLQEMLDHYLWTAAYWSQFRRWCSSRFSH